MTHHRNFYFEKVSSRTTLGGNTPPGPHYAQTQRDSNVISFARALPPDALVNSLGVSRGLSITTLKLGQIAQALIDGLAVVVCSVLVGALAASLPLAVFIMLFVKF